MAKLVSAAFCSSKRNECYIFNKQKFVVVDYGKGVETKGKLIGGPILIADEFPMFQKTLFENGIDGSFANNQKEAFFFSGNQCAKADFAPHSVDARLLMGPIAITAMFPCLVNTVFANGISAAMKSNDGKSVFLFNGTQCILLNYESWTCEETKTISDVFPQFVGTAFQDGFDATLNTHDKNEAYIFKGEYYAHFDLTTGEFISGFIRKIRTDWPALRRII